MKAARSYRTGSIDAPAGRDSEPIRAQPDVAQFAQRPPQGYRAKSTQLRELAEPCIRCGFDLLMPSQPRGTREEFLDVVGIQYYRCHNCEARYARVGSRNIGAQPRKERTHVWALLAIGTGLLSCTGLALYVQRLAHRWPF